jgi:hypothetical protein
MIVKTLSGHLYEVREDDRYPQAYLGVPVKLVKGHYAPIQGHKDRLIRKEGCKVVVK